METRTWRTLTDNIAHLPRPFGSPHRAEQLPSRFGGSMALWRSKEFDQRLLFIFGGQINGHDDNRVPPGEMSNDLVAIDVDRLRWWVVDVAGGAVAARKEAELVVVDDQIFLFGGTTLVDGGEKKIDSYSVCSLQAGQWRWEVRDEPYPAHVPATDNWRHVVVLQNQKVLMAKWRLEDSFILFDITSRTFERRAAVDFPQRPDYEWPNIRALPPNLTVGNSACAMAYTIDDKSPEVYIYSVQPPGWRSLQLGRQIAELQQEKKVKFELLITLGSKAYLFGWTEGSQEWDVFVEIPRQSMILNAH
ncbi:hypothetical protein C8R46DRAFT_669963 [Mycena filopes]|nr:hypothetical protein C8R46DRAFT_669963 [Mycena filopes]